MAKLPPKVIQFSKEYTKRTIKFVNDSLPMYIGKEAIYGELIENLKSQKQNAEKFLAYLESEEKDI